MHVPVEFKDATHDTTIVLDHTFSGQEFDIQLGFVPTQVILDPLSWMLHANDVITQTTNPLSLTTSVTGTSFCPNASLNVSYTATGSFAPANIFTAELSDASGSFSNPTVIGTLSSNDNSGTVPCVLASSLPSGAGYRVRVVGNHPDFTGSDNGSDLTLNSCGIPTGIVASNVTATSAMLSWGAVNCAIKYPTQYRVAGGTWIKKSAPTTSKSLINLTPNTTYKFKVQSKCTTDGVQKSVFSAVKTFVTLSAKDGSAENQGPVSEMNIYPNPTRSDFVVEVMSDDVSTAQISIYSVLGEKLSVRTVTLQGGKNDVSFQDQQLLPGVYFVAIQTGNNKAIRKITIE